MKIFLMSQGLTIIIIVHTLGPGFWKSLHREEWTAVGAFQCPPITTESSRTTYRMQ